MTKRIVPVLLFGWLLLAGTMPALATPLTMGAINNDPAEEVRLFLPIAQYLAAQLAPQGITKGQVMVADSVQEMAQFMKSGRVDLYLDSPLPSVVVNQMAGGNMVLRRWKQGQAEYRSVLFVKRDSPIHTLAQLSGQLVGFKDPHSSSSYLMPRIAMEQAGLQLVDMTGVRGGIPANKTGYLFTNDRETNLFWVVTGKTVAGAMSPEELTRQAKGDRDKLRILYEAEAIPRHVVSLRGDLPAAVATALTEALLAMEHTATGQRILADFEQTTRFDRIPPATQAQLQEMAPALLSILNTPP
ncbi:MAG: phosphate/phosphite/phosphonate ABC transporter substrate-binding protein [Magnetococcales bacterium]|nr:phosphate/phosphite/phosphonate ABC transporter substrate-binding protein [Magnetococcales bacterium]